MAGFFDRIAAKKRFQLGQGKWHRIDFIPQVLQSTVIVMRDTFG
jgi:hypothetical protein